MAATSATPATLMSYEPYRCHTLSSVHSLVHIQAERYREMKPLKLDSTPFTTPNLSDTAFWALIDRLDAFAEPSDVTPASGPNRPQRTLKQKINKPRKEYTRYGHGVRNYLAGRENEPERVKMTKRDKDKPNGKRVTWANEVIEHSYSSSSTQAEQPTNPQPKANAKATMPDMLHEELLLSLSTQIQFRINCQKQASAYSEMLDTTLPPCEDYDVKCWLDKNMYIQIPVPVRVKRMAFWRIKQL